MIDFSRNFSGEIVIRQSKNNKSLYIHQKDAINKLNKESKKSIYKALLVIPTGGGKTFTSIYWVLNQMIDKGKKVLWIAHRHELLNQTIKTAIDSSSSDIVPNRESFRYRIISGVHDRPVNIRMDDDFIVASKDSLNNGKEYLEKWIEQNKDNICLIIDEAHHAVAKSYRNIINILEEKCTKDLKIIGLTATPMRTDEKEKGLLGRIFTDNICYSIDLNDLINKKILATPILREFDTKIELEKELTKADIRAIRMSSNLPENVASQIALSKKRNNFIVSKYMENKDEYGKCLVFAVNVQHAIALNAIFKENKINSDYVVSSIRDMTSGVTISNEENAQKIMNFRNGKLDVLINVNILTEGTDIPNVQSVFLTRPTTSSILMNQMIGRALRGTSAGGTENAYIVSFIDDWKGKINWASPTNVLSGGEIKDHKKKANKQLAQSLIPVKLIEEFAKFMNGSVTNVGGDYMDSVPLGSYNFTLFDENNDTEENCTVLVFKELEENYKNLMNNLGDIFNRYNVEVKGDAPTDKELDIMYNHILNNEFKDCNLEVGFNEEDIKDIFRYYDLTEEAPRFIPFEGRDNFNVSLLAREITENDFGPKKQNEFLSEKWENEELGWKIYFNNNYYTFISEVNRAIYNELNPVTSKSVVKPDPIDYKKLSLSQLYKIDRDVWLQIRNEVYKKAMDEDGYYVSASGTYKSKNKNNFQIDHIIPMSKGGLTELDNLQLLTKWENYLKGDKVQEDIKDLDLYLIKEAITDCYKNEEIDKALELIDIVLKVDKDSIVALNTRSEIELNKGNYLKAIEYANKVLAINEENYYALSNKALARYNNEKYDLAVETLQTILEIEKDDIWAMNLLGDCYLEQEKYSLAKNYYLNVLKLDSDDFDANFGLGYVSHEKGQRKLALQYYKKAIKSNNKSHESLNNIGFILFEEKKYEEAIKYYDKAIEIDPCDLYIQNRKDAKEELDKLLALNI